MPWSSNGTFLVDVCLRRRGEVLGVYKPEARRAAAVGLPAGALRGGRSRPTSSPRRSAWALVPPTVGATTGPSAPGRCSSSSPPTPTSTTSRSSRTRANHDARCGAWRLRHPRQQHRPQGRPRPARRRRPDLGHRQRPLLPRGVQAAHGDLGVRRRPVSTPTLVERSRRCSTARRGLPGASPPARRRRARRRGYAGPGPWLHRPPLPHRPAPAAATPGPWSRTQPAAALAHVASCCPPIRVGRGWVSLGP